MNAEVLKLACESLGWKYTMRGEFLLVTDINTATKMYGEFALKLNISTNEVTYNTYYINDAVDRVNELKNKFQEINVEYSKNALIHEFEKAGFTYRTDFSFVPRGDENISFFMDAKSCDVTEEEPYASIRFTIMKDGTIVTDSDYLPNDVNEKAHEAMDVLEQLLGNKRVMKKKPVPAKYIGKMKPRRINSIDLKSN
jgi:hypothetical protein